MMDYLTDSPLFHRSQHWFLNPVFFLIGFLIGILFSEYILGGKIPPVIVGSFFGGASILIGQHILSYIYMISSQGQSRGG